MIGAVILLNGFVTYQYFLRTEIYGPFMNLAGRQLSLCERMSLLIELLPNGDRSVGDSLARSIDTFEETLRVFESGGAILDYELPRAPREVGYAVTEQRMIWTRLRPIIERSVSARTPLPEEDRRDAQELAGRLLDSSVSLIEALDRWRGLLRTRLLYLGVATSLFGLLALGVSFKLAWDYLVTPVRRLKRAALRASEGANVETTGDEIQAVARAVSEMTSDVGRLRFERRHVERELRLIEADYRSIFDNAVAGIFRFDSTGAILMANAAFARILGFSSPEELKSSVADVHRELFLDDQHRAKFEKLRRTRGSVQLETRVRRKDGSVIWVLESARAAERNDGYGNAICEAVVVDVTPMKRAQESLRELSYHLLRSQDQERRRIARELHDSTGQLLAALSMEMSRIDETLPSLQSMVKSSMELASKCSNEIRSMSYLLHPPLLEEFGLVTAIRDYAKGFSERSGIEVKVDLPSNLERLPIEAEMTLFRVVQEALTNIHRHAGSPIALIRLRAGSGGVALEVEDRGRGIPAEVLSGGKASVARLGVGVRGMEERLRQLGGWLEIESGGDGTRVKASLPMAVKASHPS